MAGRPGGQRTGTGQGPGPAGRGPAGLEQGVELGGGTGALLALPLVRAAAALAAELPVQEGPVADPEEPGGDPDAGRPGGPAALDAT